MRKLWIGTLLAPFVLSLTATKAAVEPSQEQITVLSSEATYVGPLLHDQALRQRQSLQREQRTGVIDVYNVWTSDVKVKLNSALRVTGHSYQICQSGKMYFGHLIFNGGGPIQVQVQHKLNNGGGSLTCTYNISTSDFWLLTCEVDPSSIRPGYYKVTSNYRVTSGGSGGGKETAWFDIFGSC